MNQARKASGRVPSLLMLSGDEAKSDRNKFKIAGPSWNVSP